MHANVYTLTMRYREASQMQPLLNPTQSKQQVLRSFRNDPWCDHRPPMSTDKEIQHPVVHKALAMQYTPYVHTTVSIMVREKSKAPRCSVFYLNHLQPSCDRVAAGGPGLTWHVPDLPVCRTQALLQELFFPKHNEKPLEDVHESCEPNRNVHESCLWFVPRERGKVGQRSILQSDSGNVQVFLIKAFLQCCLSDSEFHSNRDQRFGPKT